MDVLGLALAIPAVVVANCMCVLVLRFGVSRWPKVVPWLLWPSYFVVAIALVDVVVVATIGAVAARTLIGPVFWPLHLLVFLLGAPAVAAVLVLPRRGLFFRHWYATVALCCVVGVFLVLFQVGVGGALYTPDGDGGPFSWLTPDTPYMHSSRGHGALTWRP